VSTDYTPLTDLIWAVLAGATAAFVCGLVLAAWRDWKNWKSRR
jgi:hypothetical protein